MSATVQITLTPEAVRRLASFRAAPQRLLPVIARVLDRRNELTVGYIQRFKLSVRGPNTLGVRTNRLRSSVRPALAQISGDAVLSGIGSNVRYAGVHEFGYTGRVQVRAFTRRQVTNDIVGGQRRGFRAREKREKISASGVARVRAHTRQVRIPERAPIRRGIDANAVLYRRDLSDAIVRLYDQA